MFDIFPHVGMLKRVLKRNSKLKKIPKKPSKPVRCVLINKPILNALLLRTGYSVLWSNTKKCNWIVSSSVNIPHIHC